MGRRFEGTTVLFFLAVAFTLGLLAALEAERLHDQRAAAEEIAR